MNGCMNRYRVYCGPTLVDMLADRLRANGLNVVCRGTEHLYVEAHTPQVVLRACGTGWTWRDVTPTRLQQSG